MLGGVCYSVTYVCAVWFVLCPIDCDDVYFSFCVFCVLGVADCDFVFWIYVCCDITLHIVCGALSAALEAVYMCLV